MRTKTPPRMGCHHRAAANAAPIATHNPDLAQRMDRTVALEGGVPVQGVYP